MLKPLQAGCSCAFKAYLMMPAGLRQLCQGKTAGCSFCWRPKQQCQLPLKRQYGLLEPAQPQQPGRTERVDSAAATDIQGLSLLECAHSSCGLISIAHSLCASQPSFSVCYLLPASEAQWGREALPAPEW